MTDNECLGRNTNFYTQILEARKHLLVVLERQFYSILADPELLVYSLSIHGPDARGCLFALVETLGELLANLRVERKSTLTGRLGRTSLCLSLKHLPIDPLLDRWKDEHVNSLVERIDRLGQNFHIQIRSVIHPDYTLTRLDELGELRVVIKEMNFEVLPLLHTEHVNIHSGMECRGADGLVARDHAHMDRHFVNLRS